MINLDSIKYFKLFYNTDLNGRKLLRDIYRFCINKDTNKIYLGTVKTRLWIIK